MWTVLGLLAGLLGGVRPRRDHIEEEAVTTPLPVSARSR
jgi:hypothetical protein